MPSALCSRPAALCSLLSALPFLLFAAATQTSTKDDDLGTRRVLVRARRYGNQLVPSREWIPPIYLGDEQRNEAGRRQVQADAGKLDQRPRDPGGGGQQRRRSRRRVRQRRGAYVLPEGGVGERRLEGYGGRRFFGHNRTQALRPLKHCRAGRGEVIRTLDAPCPPWHCQWRLPGWRHFHGPGDLVALDLAAELV